jgi:N12 class adenine-specific DNA methylase
MKPIAFCDDSVIWGEGCHWLTKYCDQRSSLKWSYSDPFNSISSRRFHSHELGLNTHRTHLSRDF